MRRTVVLLGALMSASLVHAEAIKLDSGATLSLPADTRYVKEVSPLPPNQLKASVYQLHGGAFMLVNVLKPDGATCSASLDRAVKQFEEAKKDPSFPQLFKFTKAERTVVGKAQAFYTEGGGRTAEEARANKPFHLGAGYLVCVKNGMLNLTLINQQGEVGPDDLAAFKGIAASLHP